MTSATKNPLRKNAYRGDPLAEPPPPELAAILDHHRGQPDALITALEEIQRHYGYLGKLQLQYVARELAFPLARVYGVATFYNLFRFDPPGKHQVRVCRGTACHVNRSDEILRYLSEHLGIDVDETTATATSASSTTLASRGRSPNRAAFSWLKASARMMTSRTKRRSENWG